MSNCKNCNHYQACLDTLSTAIVIPLQIAEAVLNKKYKEFGCKYFEDKELFVKLPCKVGDTLYCLYKDRIQDMKKSANEQPKPVFRITEGKINSILIDKNGVRYLLNIVMPSTAFESEFGKTVFLTKEDAEKALHIVDANKTLDGECDEE